MKLLAELRPKFIRLPGGNYLEGSRFADRFNWKQMIGPAEQRPGHMGCWGYRSSDGFGLPEYLLWCKQLGAEPVLGLFAGYVLNGDHFKAGSPEMALYTQEALEEIEYVSGPADSEWGKKRAADGFPEPFPLHYVEIGNEDWFDRSGSYDGRFTQMARAIRERYPHLKIIATAPVKSFKPDLYDDHFYRRRTPAHADGHDVRPADRRGAAADLRRRRLERAAAGRDPDVRGRVGHPGRPADAHPQRRTGRRRVRDGPGEELGRGGDGVLCSVVRQREPRRHGEGLPEGVAMEHEPHRVRRAAELRLAELLRAGDARPEQGRRRASPQARRAGGGLELGLRHGHLRQGRAHRDREGRERGNHAA